MLPAVVCAIQSVLEEGEEEGDKEDKADTLTDSECNAERSRLRGGEREGYFYQEGTCGRGFSVMIFIETLGQK